MSLLRPNLKGIYCIPASICSHLSGYIHYFNDHFPPFVLTGTESIPLPWFFLTLLYFQHKIKMPGASPGGLTTNLGQEKSLYFLIDYLCGTLLLSTNEALNILTARLMLLIHLCRLLLCCQKLNPGWSFKNSIVSSERKK